ncbi:MAG: hypothetical protein ACFHVJ_15895 [Aestuariibacter sp.]
MSNIYVIDGIGLAGLAIIYHDKNKSHPLFKLFSPSGSLNKKYITTEASIMAAFSMVADMKKPKLTEALKRVVRYFFDMTVLHFEIEYKDSAKLCQDYGTFVQGVGTQYSPYILDSGFLAVELYPGAVIVGKDSPFYRSEGVTVHAI